MQNFISFDLVQFRVKKFNFQFLFVSSRCSDRLISFQCTATIPFSTTLSIQDEESVEKMDRLHNFFIIIILHGKIN